MLEAPVRRHSRLWLVFALAHTACGGSGELTGAGSGPAEPSWSAPQLVLDGVFRAEVATDDVGTILLGWEEGYNVRNSYSGQSVWAKRFVPESGWGPSQMLYDRGRGQRGGLSLQVAVSSSGGAVAAWSVDYEALWVDMFDPTSGWSTPVRLAEVEYWSGLYPVFPRFPVVAAGGADAGFVAFNRTGCTRRGTENTCAVTTYATYASRWSLKDGLSSPEVVLQAPLAHPEPALLAADGAGNAFLAEVEYPSLSFGAVIAVARFDATQGWLSPVVFPAPNQHGVFAEALVTEPTGNALVLWSFGEGTLWAASFHPSIGWVPPHRVDSSNSTVRPNYATAAWDRNGGAAVVWLQRAPSSLWASRLDSFGAWGTPQALQTDTSAYCPAVAAHGSQGFVAAWSQIDAIWAARFTPRQGWGKPVLVAAAGSVGCPMLAATPDGHSLLFWEQSLEPPSPAGDKGKQVYMSRLDSQ
jgi:hypothetical protein